MRRQAARSAARLVPVVGLLHAFQLQAADAVDHVGADGSPEARPAAPLPRVSQVESAANLPSGTAAKAPHSSVGGPSSGTVSERSRLGRDGALQIDVGQLQAHRLGRGVGRSWPAFGRAGRGS